MILFIRLSGFLIFILVVISIQSANANNSNLQDEWHLNFPKIQKVTAETDFTNQRIIITANLLSKWRSTDETLLYGGTFSPTIATDLKPLKNHRLNTFAQVVCMTTDCSQLGVVIGIRSTAGNPYAYNEQRFVITRRD